MAKNPMIGFQVDRSEIRYVGHDLQRPECILAEPDGTLWTADARGGVVKIMPDGKQEIVTQAFAAAFQETADEASRFTRGTLPNGLAFAENGEKSMIRQNKTQLKFMLTIFTPIIFMALIPLLLLL